MKFGPIVADPTSDEAKALIGKKVMASDFYVGLKNEDKEFCELCVLDHIDEDDGCPFYSLGEGDFFQTYTFIREAIEEPKRYVPYDLSNPAVRNKLRGRWYREKKDGFEVCVSKFYQCTDGKWLVDSMKSEEFFLFSTWLDGSPCGEEVTE